MYFALSWLHESNNDPTAADVLRCEPREFVRTGQVGFDIGRTSAVRRQMYEAKAKPRKQDIFEFVRSAVVLAQQAIAKPEVDYSLTLVSETATGWHNRLELLWSLGQEAVDGAELADLVRREDDGPLNELLGQFGGDPMLVLTVIGHPEVHPEQALERSSAWFATYLCENGRGDDLRTRLTETISDGSRSRLSEPLHRLVGRLAADGLLAPARGVDTSTADSRLVRAISVLQECVVPLPASALAAGAGVTEAVVQELLDEHLEQGGVERDATGAYYCPPMGNARLQSDPDANARALEKLTEEAARHKERYAHQAPNALALAAACASTRPQAVTHVFVAFDKAAKAWGDLSLTYRLAQLATQAIHDELDRYSDERRERALVQDMVHTKICGQAWVLQRVDELEDAHRELREANALTREFNDPANRAFGLKCEGRIMRMRAEALPVDHADRASLLQASEEILRTAYDAFEALLATAPHFSEDHGECLSLLGRTLATAQNFDNAALEIERAEAILSVHNGSKAYADLVILKGDVVLARRSYEEVAILTDEDEADARELLARIENLIDEQDALAMERFTPGSSEVAARARVLAGRLHELFDEPTSASTRYQEAADLYDHLRYPGAHDEALWKAMVVSEEGIPEGLHKALDDVDAQASVRLIALESWRQQAPQGGVGAQTRPAVSSPLWAGYVSEATRKSLARKTKWGEGRSA